MIGFCELSDARLIPSCKWAGRLPRIQKRA
jgi:hypothetical protein